MAGSAVSLAVTAVISATAIAFCVVAAAALQSQRVAHAADAGALAAADAASGAISGYPCERAAEAAAAFGAVVVVCDLTGLVATVAVSAGEDPMRVTATSRAGPPP